MSNPNLPLGLAIVAGAAATGVACKVGGLDTGGGAVIGALVAGIAYIFQGQKAGVEEEREVESKKPKSAKKVKKTSTQSQPQVSASPEPEKKKPKKNKKSESKPDVAPKSPAPKATPPKASPPSKSPAAQAPKQQKSPNSPSVENDEKPELTKTQLQKLKKKAKKESEEKAKAEEKALEVKREAAAAKKAQKQAQKKKEVASPTQAKQHEESSPDVKEEEELEPGWERPSARKTFKISKGPNDKKKSSNKSKDISDKKGEKVVVEVKVDKKRHGNIIGKGGVFLQKIQDTTGAKITMPKREGGGLGVVIEGSAAQVKEAKAAIEEISAKGYCSITHPDNVSNTITLEDPSLVGRIAGKKGEFLQKIQQKSGATLQLPDKNSDNAVITISGKPADIMNAKIAIMDLINQGYSEYTHPGWAAEEVDFPSESLGRLIGPGGAKIKSLCEEFRVKIDTPKQGEEKQNVIVIKGHQSNIDQAKEAIAELLVVNTEPEEPPAPDPNDPWQQEPSEAAWD